MNRTKQLALSIGFTLACACSSHEQGVALSLHSVHRTTEEQSEATREARSFVTSRGVAVTMTRGYFNIGSIEILSCPKRAWLRGLGDVFSIKTAHAHSEGSATRLGVPHVDDLRRPDLETLTLGELRPAAGSYCSGRVLLAPADEDAVGLPGDVDLVGIVVLLEGLYSVPGDTEPQPFRFALTQPLAIELEFAKDQRLELTTATARGELQLLTTTSAWFEGLEFGGETALADLASNVQRTTQLIASVGDR